MTDENFENELRRALRPVDAPAGSPSASCARCPHDARTPVTASRASRARAPLCAALRRCPAALAASLLVAVLSGQHVADRARAARETAAGLAASRELMQALRVTSQKLDLAYQAVKGPPPRG